MEFLDIVYLFSKVIDRGCQPRGHDGDNRFPVDGVLELPSLFFKEFRLLNDLAIFWVILRRAMGPSA